MTFWKFQKGEFKPHKFRQIQVFKVKHFSAVNTLVFNFYVKYI